VSSNLSLVLDVLAAPLPNPAAVDPTGGNNAIGLLISYTKWGVLIVCAVIAVASGGFMAWGKMSDRPDSATKGQRALMWSGIGVIASAVAIPMINAVQSAAG
jgi:hypothetical protein